MSMWQVRTQAWDSPRFKSASITNLGCDLGQVTSPVWVSVFFFFIRRGPSLTGSSHRAGAPYVAAAIVAMLQRVLTDRGVSPQDLTAISHGAAGRVGVRGCPLDGVGCSQGSQAPPSELFPSLYSEDVPHR